MIVRADSAQNHIAHHVLTLFALGASPAELQQAYDDNATYQRAPSAVNEAVVADLRNPARWAAYLGREKHYGDFLVFFQREMADKGWEAVVCEYVLCGDARADNMLVRMFAGFLHPIIHLGFGIEFRQPAIVAEGLAQAAVHGDWMPFLQWEQAAEATRGKGERKTIVQLLDEVRGDEKVSGAARWEDGNKIRDGLMKRAPDELSAYVSQFTVGEDELEERTAEMINAAGMLHCGASFVQLADDKLQFTSRVPPSGLRMWSSLTFTTCTASIRPFSSPTSSQPQTHSSAHRSSGGCWSGRCGTTLPCTLRGRHQR
jgi:hypothetical protein